LLEEHRGGLVGEDAGLDIRREVHPVELLQWRFTGRSPLTLFRSRGIGDRLSKAQAIKHREHPPVGVGVLDRETCEILMHARVEIKRQKNSAITGVSGECQPIRLLPCMAGHRIPPSR
jgi:hypothetical protein